MTPQQALRPHRRAVRRPGRGFTVALVGADGAGKSTLSRMLAEASGVTPDLPPIRTIYMGVNLEASSLMLPTTRLLLAAKRARGHRPDLTATVRHATLPERVSDGRRAWRRSAKDGARLGVWVLEEWLRLVVATGYRARGYVVVFDRHFVADYHDADGPDSSGAPARLHRWMLRRVYPKPALTICLDAPGAVLYARKPEASLEWLEQRRQQYLRLGDVVPAFVAIDATRPVEAVFDEVVGTIHQHWKAASA